MYIFLLILSNSSKWRPCLLPIFFLQFLLIMEIILQFWTRHLPGHFKVSLELCWVTATQTWPWISYCQHSVTWNGTQLAYFVASSFCYRQFNRIRVSHWRDACEQLMTCSRVHDITSALFWVTNVPSSLAPALFLFFSCRLANWKNCSVQGKSHISNLSHLNLLVLANV